MSLPMYLRQCHKYSNILPRHWRMVLLSPPPAPPSSISLRSKQTQPQKDDDENSDNPVQFSYSKAATWKAQYSREGPPTKDRVERPWYDSLVMMLSIAVFLLHFCVLREENDFDKEFEKSLYDRIDGLEEHQLRESLKYNIEKGIDITAIQDRLKEIEESKKY